jgi:hypothetical protein
MSEAQVKLQKIRLVLEKLEQGIRECREVLKGEPKQA